MRLQVLGVACLALSLSSAAQVASTTDTPTAALTQDQQAQALIQQVLTASGPIISATSLTATLGTYRSGTDSNLYPVRIYTMGNNRVRSEIDRSSGVPGLFCTSSDERDWTKRSGRWRRARSIHLNRL
jgi:Flp pilus assembly protein TadG